MGIIAILIFCHCKSTDWAHECATRYPVKADTVVTQSINTLHDTIIVEKTVKVTQTVNTVCPPSSDTVIVSKEIYVDCPSEVIHEKIIVRHDSIIIHVTDPAQTADINNQLEETKKTLEKSIRWKNIFLGAMLLELLLVLLFYFSVSKIKLFQ